MQPDKRPSQTSEPAGSDKAMPVMRQRAEYDRQNIEAAKLIAAAPERYAGPTLAWAHRIIERHELVDEGGGGCGAAQKRGSTE